MLIKNTLVQKTLFVDTQILIYAFEKCEPVWVEFIESRLSSGYRLVLSEDILYEFGQSRTLDAALNLTRCVVEREPLWIRSFADLEVDEVCRFVRTTTTIDIAPVTVFSENFSDVSQLTERRQLNPEEFVRSAFDPKFREGYLKLANNHAHVLNELSKAISRGQLTKELNDQALRVKLRALLSLGSDLASPFYGSELDDATKYCFKHHRQLMRNCSAYATECHLSDYRTSSPKRLARVSDSRDLMIATAAFPNVTSFATNDGYLYGALSYVKKKLSYMTTELIRHPGEPLIVTSAIA